MDSTAMWSSTIFGLILVAIVMLVGIHPLRSHSTGLATFTEFVCHALGAMILIVGICISVAQIKVHFEKFGVELSTVQLGLILVSDTAIRYIRTLIPFLFAFIVGDAVIYWELHQKESTRTYARIWSGAVTALIVIVILFLIAGIGGTL